MMEPVKHINATYRQTDRQAYVLSIIIIDIQKNRKTKVGNDRKKE